MFQFPELRITFGVTPELKDLVSEILGYALQNKRVESIEATDTTGVAKPVATTKKPKGTKPTSEDPPAEVVAETSTDAIADTVPEVAEETTAGVTVEILRKAVADTIKADREKRPAIEAKFAEFGASNPTSLDVKHYSAFIDFLNNL